MYGAIYQLMSRPRYRPMSRPIYRLMSGPIWLPMYRPILDIIDRYIDQYIDGYLTNKEASTVLCFVVKHAGSGRARKKCRGKHET